MGPSRTPHTIASILGWARRRLLIPTALAVAVGVAVVAPPGHAASVAAEAERSLTPGKRRDEVVDVYEKLKASVINIHSERTVTTANDDPFSRTPVVPQRVNGMGTGIVLDSRGYVLTNFHVIDDVQSLRCRLHDGTSYTARVVAFDKEADLAIIKIDPVKPLPVVNFGTSTDLMIGEPVIAIGNAYGYEHTVTDGRVSFKGRDVTLNKEVSYKNLIQTSAPINPGNSGGPLLNVLGELVGVNVAIRAGAQNIGFALPIDFCINRAAEMIGPRRRGGLRHGMIVKNLFAREATERTLNRTVKVEMIEPGSPAAEAGVQIGDIVDQVENISVHTSIDLERGFLEKSTGAKVPVKLTRGKSTLNLELTMQPTVHSALTAEDTVSRRLGIRLQPVGVDAVSKANPQLHGGLVVVEVTPGSVAAASGIQRGDVLVGLHQWETLTLENVVFVLNHKDFVSFQPLKFYLARDGKLRDGWIRGTP